jgi:hypothetical protein
MLRITLTAAALVVATATWAQDVPEGHRVEINGMQLYYEVSGAGDPLIVLHGSQMSILRIARSSRGSTTLIRSMRWNFKVTAAPPTLTDQSPTPTSRTTSSNS